MKLEKGKKYNPDKFNFLCWNTGENYIPGYFITDYFDKDGKYLGPDNEGVEPEFSKA